MEMEMCEVIWSILSKAVCLPLALTVDTFTIRAVLQIVYQLQIEGIASYSSYFHACFYFSQHLWTITSLQFKHAKVVIMISGYDKKQ